MMNRFQILLSNCTCAATPWQLIATPPPAPIAVGAHTPASTAAAAALEPRGSNETMTGVWDLPDPAPMPDRNRGTRSGGGQHVHDSSEAFGAFGPFPLDAVVGASRHRPPRHRRAF